MESQLEVEKEKVEADAKKLQSLILEYSKEKENDLNKKMNTSTTLKLTSRLSQSELISDESPTLFNKQTSSVYDLLRNSSAINTLESLQSKLKEKDGEIQQLQVNYIYVFMKNHNLIIKIPRSILFYDYFKKNINDLERIRESLAKELVNLSSKIETLESQVKSYPELEEQLNVIIIVLHEILLCF